jgi:D-glycerate 3-kinase
MSRKELPEKILERILPFIKHHQTVQSFATAQKPFILGLTGLQGCGKSTLAADLVDLLNTKYGHRATEISLDDFYKTHDEREALRIAHAQNELLEVRGQPGTHDIALAEWVFGQFPAHTTSRKIEIPAFDKSLFGGDGDRVPRSTWRSINISSPIEVIVFEGWCLGFQGLSHDALKAKWYKAKEQRSAIYCSMGAAKMGEISSLFSTTTLAQHRLEDLSFVNDYLSEYCERFMGPQHFDWLVHLDTLDLVNVYTWRMGQEHMLRKSKGTSMTDHEVVQFGELESRLEELRFNG